MTPGAEKDAIVGVWRLVAYGDRESESDPWTPTFGDRPTGFILYHPTGLLTVQASAAAEDPTAEFQYIGYFGTYLVREAIREGAAIVGIVEHHMEAAFPPELLDEGFDRPFRIEGNHLTLGDGRTSRRSLERLS